MIKGRTAVRPVRPVKDIWKKRFSFSSTTWENKMDTIETLEQISAQAEQDMRNEVAHRTFTKEFEESIIQTLLVKPEPIMREFSLLTPDAFSDPCCGVLFGYICNYNEEFKVMPDRKALWMYFIDKSQIIYDEDYERYEKIVNFHQSLEYNEIMSLPKRIGMVLDHIKQWMKERLIIKTSDVFKLDDINDEMERQLELHKRIKALDGENEGFPLIDFEELMMEEKPTEWLIKDILSADQPFIVGGKDKCLKTGTLCDIAYSLATGTNFYNYFIVQERQRVLFFSAESGRDDIRRRMAAIRKTRQESGHRGPEKGYLTTIFERPQLSSDTDLIRLSQAIEKTKAKVVIIDPLYLTLLAGGDGKTSASDLYQMGPLFAKVTEVIAKQGATTVLSHHYRTTTPEGKLGLAEFTFVGAGSFARQSFHIGRRRAFTSPRNNEMCIMTHGAGRGQRYDVNIDEDQNLDGWVVDVMTDEQSQKSFIKDILETKVDELEMKLDTPMGKTMIREVMSWSGATTTSVLEKALQMGVIRQVEINGTQRYEKNI